MKILTHSLPRFGVLSFAALLSACQAATAADIALSGNGILGFQAAIDDTPGQQYYASGVARNIVDGDLNTRVDNWSNGADGGKQISFVGVVWPHDTRYESVGSAVLTLAAFGDGGWFGPNDSGPGWGQLLSPEYLVEPTVQVSTDKGLTWTTVAATSDYMANLNGAGVGGGTFPNPNPLTATFTFSSPITQINGLRLIGPNGGTADHGFLGVFELEVQATFADSDGDGMPDPWEQAHGLNVGTNDANGDADSDGLANLQEYVLSTDPKNPDCDGDGYSDGTEVAAGTDPFDPKSIPGNLAREGTAILGTQSPQGIDTPVFNAGLGAFINDGDMSTRVDTFNYPSADKLSFVGITWDQPQPNPVLRLELTMATFWDGGWFGPNNSSPGAGNKLTPAYLTEPRVQVISIGSAWTDVPRVSDYLNTFNGHGIGGGANPNPTSGTATFILDPPVPNITGVRIIGSEGGLASGGFIGVFELKVYARTDSDNDGMDDDWERQYGLVVGVNDAAADPDGDGLTNLQEYQKATDPKKPDTDNDGLNDGAEVNIHHTNPVSADTDGDRLQDGEELQVYLTNPLDPDTDKDGFIDGIEVANNSNPTIPASIPANLAFRSDATGILGTEDYLGGTDTFVANAGSAVSVKDGDLTTRVDTWNGDSLDTLSFVGIAWTNTVTNVLTRLELSLATFFDGGWFGYNNAGPGAGGTLSSNIDLVEPAVQVTSDGGTTWTPVTATTDYMTALDGHALPAVAFGEPTLAAVKFTLSPGVTGINGVRVIGYEGGTASAGFLGVFELGTLMKARAPVILLNPRAVGGKFGFDFDTETGATYVVEQRPDVAAGTWSPLMTITGDGTRKAFSENLGAGPRFYRVSSQ